MKPHWLERPGITRSLWIVYLCMLALTLLASLLMEEHAVFGIEGSFAFAAWFGFLSCIGMIVFAKLLGRLLQRKDTYYDRD